ncbi:MAG: hypothetical protein V4501_08280 [Pseudomonadota bacterium]
MSKVADDICAEIKSQFNYAEHFKNLWIQANDEKEKVEIELSHVKCLAFEALPDVVKCGHLPLAQKIEALQTKEENPFNYSKDLISRRDFEKSHGTDA